jgi:hypothetical protein
MVIVVAVCLLVLLVACTAKGLLHTGHTPLKLLLAASYAALGIVLTNVYYAASAADEGRPSGIYSDWFGGWWAAVVLALFVAITALHVRLYTLSRRGPAK